MYQIRNLISNVQIIVAAQKYGRVAEQVYAAVLETAARNSMGMQLLSRPPNMKHRKHNKYTKEMLQEAVSKSRTWAEVCKNVGINPITGAQSHLRSRAAFFGIDFSHFRGSSWNAGMEFPTKRNIEEYLVNCKRELIKSSALKKRLIAEGIKEKKCEVCGMADWLGENIPLELHHINGIHNDNRLENLMIICPNCHASITAKNRPRNKKKKHLRGDLCSACGIEISRDTKNGSCSKCFSKSREKIMWPNRDKLAEMVWSMPTSKIGEMLGVSDKAIDKRCKALGISKPGRGYWQKNKTIGP